MTKTIILSALFIFLLSSCAISKKTLVKPSIFEYGSSMTTIKQNLEGQCDSVITMLNEPIKLPTVKNSQSQLDVYGYKFAGKRRKVELIFADDALDIIWVLTEAEEEENFIEQLKKMYREPTHVTADATFFLDNGTAVRNQPHEILFLSPRLKEPYRQFLNNQ